MGSIIKVNNTRENLFNLLSRITEIIINREISIYKEFNVTELL